MRRRRLRVTLGALAVSAAAMVLSVMTPGAVAVDLPTGTMVDDEQVAELAIEALDGDSGKPLAVRARIAPTRPWRTERVLIDRSGKLRAALLAGAYHVSISHGPEWSIFEQDVQLQPGQRAKLRASLSREVDASEYTACDLHVHSAASPDSNLSLTERVSTLLAEDVQFAVLTDHNAVTDAVRALAAVGIASLPGVEVTTWAPELGHFNVFPQRSAPRFRHPTAQRLMRELKKEPDSFVQVNHPRLEGHIGYFELAAFERARGQGSHEFPLGFDGIEVWNGYDLAAPSRRDEVFLDWLALVARGQRITATGNSDSHKAGLAPYVGYPRTYVRVPRPSARTSEKVLAALKQGRAFVSNGPIVSLTVAGKEPGDTLHLARGARTVSVRVEVKAPAWMELTQIELWLGKNKVLTHAIEPTRGSHSASASMQVELPVQAERSLVATVRGSASMKRLLGRSQITPYAFTNPVWIVRH